MKRKEIWGWVEIELRKAKKEEPNWPDHVCGQAGIVVEEAGRLMYAALENKYDKNRNEIVRKVQEGYLLQSAIKTAAKAIRFLENLKIKN